MPFARVLIGGANLTSEKKVELASAISGVLASVIGKPESYCAVNVECSDGLVFGGSADPAAIVNVESIGFGSRDAIKGEVCEQISSAISSAAGVDEGRIYVNFSSFSHDSWGMGGNMFG
ncbi:unnamed protein product [Heterosigma akashiwo]|uniref:L-dopachrome isomerase n=1 Tax=Heterosigma akashiwo TaxID=2829 RepID=A0A6V1X4X8_HETAK|mmetsp:Transcript_4086/g.5763  ORF Transcript_4086/g.5763 Transcript_4086/m.5763 type:complete len:119 (-) Transcript_4086:169-525(-)